MHHALEVVHNFIKAVGVQDFCPLCIQQSQSPFQKEQGASQGILVSRLNNSCPRLCRRIAVLNVK